MPHLILVALILFAGSGIANAQQLGNRSSDADLAHIVPTAIGLLVTVAIVVAIVKFLRTPSKTPGPWNGYGSSSSKPSSSIGRPQDKFSVASSSPSKAGLLVMKNPINGYVEEIRSPGLWCLLFGGLYFGYKGVWGHAVIGLILAVLTAGISWLIYPFFARDIIIRHYLRQGWAIGDQQQ